MRNRREKDKLGLVEKRTQVGQHVILQEELKLVCEKRGVGREKETGVKR